MSYNDELTHWGVKGMKWGVRRYQNADGSLTAAGRKRRREEPHEDYTKAHSKKSIKSMSDTELRGRINRLRMEKEYGDLKSQTNKGKKAVSAYIKTAGTIASIAGATITYKKYGNQILDAIGDYALSEVTKAFN